MKKILIGMALVAVLCMVGGAGYQFGQYLAQRGEAATTATTGT